MEKRKNNRNCNSNKYTVNVLLTLTPIEISRLKELCTHMDITVEKHRRNPFFFLMHDVCEQLRKMPSIISTLTELRVIL